MTGRQGQISDEALAERLRPYWHQHRLPVCCGRCGRRITKIHRDLGHVLGDKRHYGSRWVLSSLYEEVQAITAGGDRRITFICRCGARAARRMDRLILEFIRARETGLPNLVVGG